VTARRPVRELTRLTQDACVCVAGRVVAESSGQLILQDDTGCVSVMLGEAEAGSAAIGAFVMVRGVARSGGERIDQLEQMQVLTPGGTRFTHGESEWSYLIGTRLTNLRIRTALKRAVQRFFDEAGLLEVETPAVVPCPGLDVHLQAIETLGGPCDPGWLHTSPEYQMKRLLTTGLPGIYQLGKAFRRAERGRLHEPEFMMLEWYRTFADAEQVMRDTEQLVAYAALELTGSLTLPGLEGPVDVTPPWTRITVEEAFQRYGGMTLERALEDEDTYFQVLADRIEPKLGRGRATFLMAYPAAMASLARLSPRDPRYAERFEAYLDGVELCNGFSELIDAAEQRTRLERDQQVRQALNRTVYPIDHRFIAALEEGIPPSGGNALGFDRLLMLLVGAQRIDQVVAIPSSRL